jgi:hypothetical protein
VGTPVEIAGGALAGLSMELPKQFVIMPRSGQPPARTQELRGRLLDIGRFAPDDSRLGPLDLPRVVSTAVGEKWPERQQLFVLVGATWSDTEAQPVATLRNLALQGERFEGQSVVIRGRFRGRNLLGDLPAWPRQSQWDFVLQTADAAVWIVGKRPRGDGFDLATTSRAHTGRWLEVTGKVTIVDDLPLIVADRIRTADAEDDLEVIEEPKAPLLPRPDVVFSAPAQGESGIARDVVVRVQFSRPIQPDTLPPNIRIRYADGVTETVPDWTATYRPGPIAVEIRFATPLASGAGVIVELSDAVKAIDGAALEPLTLRFTTSGTMR